MPLLILRWRLAPARRIGIMVLAFLGRYSLCPPWLGWPIRTKEGFVMTTLAQPPAGIKSRFDVIAHPFLSDPGLPFASVLDAKSIRRAFDMLAIRPPAKIVRLLNVFVWTFQQRDIALEELPG